MSPRATPTEETHCPHAALTMRLNDSSAPSLTFYSSQQMATDQSRKWEEGVGSVVPLISLGSF